MRQLVGALSAALVIVAAGTTPIAAAQIAYGATLRPASVVTDAGQPNQGDPDGFGQASVDLDPATGEVCLRTNISGTEVPTAARIHAGADGANGPAVVDLPTPPLGRSSGLCITADPAVVASVVSAPAEFYVLVTTADFPDGALRGQLRLLFCTIAVTTEDGGPEPTDLLFADEGETATVFGRFPIGARVLVTAHHDGVPVSSGTHEVPPRPGTAEGLLSVEFTFADGDDGEWTIVAEDPAVGDCRSTATINVADTLPLVRPSQPLPDTAMAEDQPIQLTGAAILALAAWMAIRPARVGLRRGPSRLDATDRPARSGGG